MKYGGGRGWYLTELDHLCYMAWGRLGVVVYLFVAPDGAGSDGGGLSEGEVFLDGVEEFLLPLVLARDGGPESAVVDGLESPRAEDEEHHLQRPRDRLLLRRIRRHAVQMLEQPLADLCNWNFGCPFISWNGPSISKKEKTVLVREQNTRALFHFPEETSAFTTL